MLKSGRWRGIEWTKGVQGNADLWRISAKESGERKRIRRRVTPRVTQDQDFQLRAPFFSAYT